MISFALPQNILSFDYSGGDSLKINLVNEDPIAGIQLKIDGIDILSASGGSAEDAGFMISATGSTLLGFSFNGASIPAGEGHMTTLIFDSDPDINTTCFSNDYETVTVGENTNILYDCTLASETGSVLDLELGECVDGCFNNSACNFLTDGECVLPTSYYQDADGDGFGNPDVNETSCEDIEGYVTNNSDEDDTCEGTIDLDGSCCISEIFDECGVCDGDGPIENFDCDGNCSVDQDCLGECGGSAVLDDCGDCNGYNAAKDACGNCEGDCIEATDGIIVCSSTENTPGNLVVADCNGVCGGEDLSCIDCAGNVGGYIEVDCNGDCGGAAYIDDSCNICIGGNTGISQCLSSYENIENDFSITSTYPNPFNPSINIKYSVPSVSYVNLQIIGLDGKHVNTITNSIQTEGKYNVQWTPENVASGMYLVQLNANNQIQNKKIVYLK